MKKIVMIFTTVLALTALLCGCVGTTVVNCTCSDGGSTYVPKAGEVKTGLAVLTDVTSADGKISYSLLMAAVAVDDEGVITDCVIDGISADVAIADVTANWTKEVKTKNELGSSYGMVDNGKAKYEWNVQAENFANYVKGKTAAQVRGIAVSESGKPADSDLAASVTIAIGDFMEVVEKAVTNAAYRGADSADTLVLAATPALSGAAATNDAKGNVQLDMDITALTRKDGVITSCTIDAVQAKVEFGADGNVTTDLAAEFQTKNELGSSYGMVDNGKAKYEWNVQAENFANYVKGKTAAEVNGIAVSEGGKPGDADLSTSVTIAIGGFKTLVEKAMK